MDVAITIVMLVPVLLAVALIIGVIRRNITERQAGDPVDISGAIPAVIVLMVAVLIIGALGNAASPYVFDEDSGELTIQKSVPQLNVQPWDSYASDVKSLVIKDGVTIGAGAFDSLTNLEYISIGEGAEIPTGAFGVSFKDCMDQTITGPDSGEYVGTGDGTLYFADGSIFTYNAAREVVTGLASDYSAAKILAFPTMYQGKTLTAIGTSAFDGNETIEKALAPPVSSLWSVSTYVFRGCTSLDTVELSMLTNMGGNTFNGCTSLESIELPLVETMPFNAFVGCTSLVSVDMSSAKTIAKNAFFGCSAITAFDMPKVTTVEDAAFNGCSGVTSVAFGPLATVSASGFPAWTFYASDGETQIDKTDASALAGKTFLGTAAALVEVADGQLSLTPQQLQQVQLHTQELQQQELDIQPLPFQPTVQTQDLEPASA